MITSIRRSLTTTIALALLPSALHAQPFDLGSPVLNPDNTYTIPFVAKGGDYYVLWRFDQPSPLQRTPHPGATPVRILVPDPEDPAKFPTYPFVSLTDPNTNLTTAFYRLAKSPLHLPGDADGDGIDDLYEIADPGNLDPFSPSDTSADPDNDGSSLLKDYYSHLVSSPAYTKPSPGTTTEPPPRPPSTTPEINLADILGIDVVNDAASDYSPDADSNGNIAFASLEGPTLPGFQYPGTYYYGINNVGNSFGRSEPTGSLRYTVDCGTGQVFSAWYTGSATPDETLVEQRALYYTIDNSGNSEFSINRFSSSFVATWPVVFPEAEWPCPPFNRSRRQLTATGELIEFFPDISYRTRTGTSLNTRRGYSAVPLDPAPSNALRARPDYGNAPNVRFDQPLDVGFFCDSLDLVTPWPGSRLEPEFTGTTTDCRRVYVARYGTDNNFEGNTARVVEFPLIEGGPVLVLRPSDPSPSASTRARLHTSTIDPRTHINNTIPANNTIAPSDLEGEGDLDGRLQNAGLYPLADLTSGNSNDFGRLFIPPSGVTIFDASLLTDDASSPAGPYVIDPEAPFQTGTVGLESLGTQCAITGFGGAIHRDGTFPWLRTSPGTHTANQPTTLTSEDKIQTLEANLTAHSIAMQSPGSISLEFSDLSTDGSPPTDPLTAETYTTDPSGNPLGYISIQSGNGILLATTPLSAHTDIFLDSPLVHTDSPLFAPDGTIAIRGGYIDLYLSTSELGFPGEIVSKELLIDGGVHDPPLSDDPHFSSQLQISGEPTLINVSPNVSADTILCDNLDSFSLGSLWVGTETFSLRALDRAPDATSLISDVFIQAHATARIVANHEIIANDSTIQNGYIATPTLTVPGGATLSLIGDNAAVYTNTHNYGKPGYGTLTINGTAIIPPPDAPPTFHLRPQFDAE